MITIHILFSYSQLSLKIDIFWSNVDNLILAPLLQNSSDFEMCSLKWDNDVMLNVVVVVWFGDPCESPGALLLTAAPVMLNNSVFLYI